MKRYLLFIGESFYAGGGWADFRGDFSSVEKAEIVWEKREYPDSYDWYHIIDAETGKVVACKQGVYCGQVGV